MHIKIIGMLEAIREAGVDFYLASHLGHVGSQLGHVGSQLGHVGSQSPSQHSHLL